MYDCVFCPRSSRDEEYCENHIQAERELFILQEADAHSKVNSTWKTIVDPYPNSRQQMDLKSCQQLEPTMIAQLWPKKSSPRIKGSAAFPFQLHHARSKNRSEHRRGRMSVDAAFGTCTGFPFSSAMPIPSVTM